MIFSFVQSSFAEKKDQAPSQPVAKVLGKDILSSEIEPPANFVEQYQYSFPKDELSNVLSEYRKRKLSFVLLGALFDQYIEENHLQPTEEELNSFLSFLRQQKEAFLNQQSQGIEMFKKELEKEGRSALDKEKIQAQIKALTQDQEELKTLLDEENYKKSMQAQFDLQTAKQVVQVWKINKSLYEKYGGRVVLQQLGPEPWDAHRQFLKEKEKQKSFQIADTQLQKLFWEYFTNEGLHQFYPPEKEKTAFDKPWWLDPDFLKKQQATQ
ncbi:MAG: hypothetical protein NUV91_00035 [Candidatus Omnitrophica bacterium]|nr:hypothetical protein [Candidatus Omnitrophota bacterium]